MSNVTAILVTYNSEQVIATALSSLLCNPAIGTVMVVDNASRDETCAIIAKRFSGVTLIKSEQNVGFGAGNNMALERVHTEYALLINPDAVLGEGALAQLLAAAARYPDAGILAPQLFYEDGSPQASYKVNFLRRKRHGGRALPPSGDLCAEFLSGAVWLVRMKAMREIGLFDPDIFFYYEDDDLCLRMNRAGYAPVLVEQAHATHLMGKSSAPSQEARKFRLYHDTWSRLYMEYKYKSHGSARRMAKRQLWRFRLMMAFGQFGRYGPRLLGVRHFLLFLAGR